MGPRRTRATSRREESAEPQEEGPVTRQTRSNLRRVEVSDAPIQSKSTSHLKSEIPQRGTRRHGRRRKSPESVATDDFPKSSGERISPDPPATGTMSAEPEAEPKEVAAPNPESQSDSYEDKAARLQDILDFDLPKLHRWCEKTYEILSSLTSPEPTAEERKNLHLARRSFKLARRPLAEDDVTYINLSSSDLPFEDDPDAHATIHKVTYSANLISLLLSLTDVKRSKQALLPFLQELDDASPTFRGLNPSRVLVNYELAFLLRVLQLVESLQEQPEAEPLVLATKIFCKEPTSTSEEAVKRLSKGPFRNLGDTEEGGDFTSSKMFKKQMGAIVGMLSLPENQRMDTLKEAISRDGLLGDLQEWALRTYLHVNKKAKENGPPPRDQNLGGANDGVERQGSNPNENDGSDAGSDSGSGSEHGYQQLKTITKEPSFIQDPTTLAAVRQSERDRPKHSGTAPPSNQQAVKGKFTEAEIRKIRQLNAADILGSSTQDAENAGGSEAPHSHSRSGSQSSSNSRELGAAGKRTRPQEDEDYVDDDDEFEVNEQLIDESRRIQHGDPNTTRLATKRSRFSGESGNTVGRSLSADDDAPASSNIRERDLVVLSQVARANRLANRPRGHQLREKWSEVDTDHLIDLIADRSLGCSWAAMEREGGFQTKRNQQAIRDKARNLKKGYLCGDAILPSGFDYVYLGKKERDDVIAAGRNPDRREDDIDEQGHVICNMWMEESD
ncbi:hypothetical protein F5Y10DRAFT_238676 [Nemania abortiva]|nr:hypothetical protein F5Y10DRAFT_238676 [Nemania abortiva]